MRISQTLPYRQRGVAIVETLVITPLLLFLLLATAEITNAFVEHNTLTKAARNGVRYVASEALSGTTGLVMLTPATITEARNLVVFGNTAGSGTPRLSGLAVGGVQVIDLGNNNIQITVSYPYTGILGNTLPHFGFGSDTSLNMNLQATVSMRAL